MQDVRIVLLGLGNVGGALLRQIVETRTILAERAGLRLRPLALADVSGALIHPDGLDDAALTEALAAASAGRLLESLSGVRPLGEVEPLLGPGVILADVTASPRTERTVRRALAAGCAVALANKLALAGPWAESGPLFGQPQLRYEVTVGAGLPVIAALRYLLDTGDHVTRIEGCLSGTLGYLCAELERGAPYSAAVSQARALGYTEPDPREDLAGRDVARKALILARTAGWPLDLDALSVERLYRAELADLSVDEFLAAMPSDDAAYAQRVAQAAAQDRVLRYVARVTTQGGEVGLLAVERSSALGALRGPGNHIALYTERYATVPLVIAGPGAGPDVTAAGVLGDLIALAREGQA